MIRAAKPEDTLDLIELGRAFHAEAGKEDMGPFDPESFCAFLDRCTSQGSVIVAEKQHRVVGMALLLTGPAWWNKNVVVGQEAAWYCKPAFRKGTGAELLAALESASRARQVSVQFVACEEGQRSEALSRLYRIKGYRPAERMFVRSLAPGS
jgi:L-amino acid N-acyltransferase YncA